MNRERVCDILRQIYSSESLAAAGVQQADQYSHQSVVINSAWKSLVEDGRAGIVLADEVGLGKTFEALGLTYLYLMQRLVNARNPRLRVLIVLPPKLVGKWSDELENFARQAEALTATQCLLPSERSVSDYLVRALLNSREISIRKAPKRQIWAMDRELSANEAGFFLIRETRLAELTGDNGSGASRLTEGFLRQNWDVLVFDEAHRYARSANGQGSQRSRAARTLCRRQQEAGAKILLCTATPFQLDTHDLIALLALIEPNERMPKKAEEAIDAYNAAIVALQQALQEDWHDEQLAGLREQAGKTKTILERLLRPYMLRSSRPEREGLETRNHELRAIDPGSEFPWTYWQVKDWARALARTASVRTFLPTTLHMTVSSPAALQQHLKSWAGGEGRKRTEASAICRRLLDKSQAPPSHPKFQSIHEFIQARIEQAVEHFSEAAAGHISDAANDLGDYKCVIFISRPATIRALIGQSGEMKRHGEELERTIRSRAEQQLETSGIDPAAFRREWRKAARQAIDGMMSRYSFAVPEKHVLIWETPYEAQTDNEYRHLKWVRLGIAQDLSEKTAQEIGAASIRETLVGNLQAKLAEALTEYDLVRKLTDTAPDDWKAALGALAEHAVTHRAGKLLDSVYRQYFGRDQVADQPREWLRLRLSRLAYAFSPRSIVEGLTGEVDFATRQQIIDGFNRDLYPLILLCSKVGEEGLDLQKRCNTVIHYDLEWNPAEMEQREGRVDRLGRQSNAPVTILTYKLKDTYDERILARCENRRIWMELYLCKKWRDEGRNAEQESLENEEPKHQPDATLEWLRQYRIDLRPDILVCGEGREQQ